MSSVVRSIAGVALLLTGTSAAMAASTTTPAANQYIQTNASTPAAASTTAPATNQYIQTNASTPVDAYAPAPIVEQSPKVHHGGLWCDNTDPYGGHGSKTHWGIRAFWDYQSRGE